MKNHQDNIEVLLFIKGLIIVGLAYLGIKEDVFYVLNGAFFFDTLFGLGKAIRLKQKITFDDFIWGILVKYCILFIPFAVAVFAKVIAGANMFYVVNAFIIIIISNELISIITNILSMKVKEDIKNEDFIASALRALQSFFNNYIKKLIENVKSGK